MVPGFNTNIEWRGVLFHVQSEDSGRAHPHIISHLYHGGTILASEKLSYAEHVDAPDLTSVVRDLMETQHEALLSRLREGAFDSLIEERLGDDVFGEPAPEEVRSAGAGEVPVAQTEGLPSDVEVAPAPLDAASAPAEDFEELLTVVTSDEQGSSVQPLRPDRPLDEWVLDYLIQSAQRRKASS